MKAKQNEANQWVLLATPKDASPQLWQVCSHHVAAGQLCWLDVKAGQWLEVMNGSVLLANAMARTVWLDGAWGAAMTMDSRSQLSLQAGAVQAVTSHGAWSVQAGRTDVTLRVWQRATRWQAWWHQRGAMRQTCDGFRPVMTPSGPTVTLEL